MKQDEVSVFMKEKSCTVRLISSWCKLLFMALCLIQFILHIKMIFRDSFNLHLSDTIRSNVSISTAIHIVHNTMFRKI